MSPNASSRATSQRTSYGTGSMPPPSNGAGASRVHSTTPFGIGSPDATPSWNGYAPNRDDGRLVRSSGVAAGVATSCARIRVGSPGRLIPTRPAAPAATAARRFVRRFNNCSKRSRDIRSPLCAIRTESGAPVMHRRDAATPRSRNRCPCLTSERSLRQHTSGTGLRQLLKTVVGAKGGECQVMRSSGWRSLTLAGISTSTGTP